MKIKHKQDKMIDSKDVYQNHCQRTWISLGLKPGDLISTSCGGSYLHFLILKVDPNDVRCFKYWCLNRNKIQNFSIKVYSTGEIFVNGKVVERDCSKEVR